MKSLFEDAIALRSGIRNAIKTRLLPAGIFAIAFALVMAGPAAAQTSGTWNTTVTATGTYLWSSGTDWVGGVIADGAGSTADFSQANLASAAVVTVSLDTNRTVGTMLIGDPTTPYGNYVISSTTGSSLTFDNGGLGALLQKNSSGDSKVDTLAVPLILNDNLTVQSNSTSATGGLTLSGSITSTGTTRNLILQANSASVITLSGSVNLSGTITNSGSGTATTLLTGGVGSNVNTIIESGTTSSLTVSTAALNVNSAGTTLINNAATGGTALFTVSGGVAGSGTLFLNNNSAIAGGITISTGTINNAGAVVNSGMGTGGVTISSIIGSSVTGVVQNSTSSSLTLGGANTFGGGLLIKSGTVIVNISNATTVSGAAGPSANAITLGSSSGTSASLVTNNTFVVSNAINLGTGAVGTLTIGNNGAATTGTFTGAIGLNGDNLTIASVGTGSTTVTGGISGTGNVTVSNGSTTATTSITTGTVNNSGTFTNSGAGTGVTTISANIGSNVANVIENSLTSGLALSGSNSNAALTIKSGTVTASTSANALGSGTVTLGDSTGGSNNAGLMIGTAALNYTNAIALAPTTTGTLSLGSTGNITTGTFSGSISGSNNLTIDNSGNTGTSTFTLSGSINNSGTITNITGVTGHTVGTILSGGIGSNVTAIVDNSANAGALTVSGSLAVNSAGTTLTDSNGASTISVTGGVGGTGNLTLQNNTATASGIAVSAGAINNSGTISDSGTGTGSVVISASIGNNVKNIVDTSNGGLTISSTTVANNGNITFSGSGAGVVTLSATSINNSGTITNNGSTTGLTTISGSIGSNVTNVIENSASSNLTISSIANTFGALTIYSGTVTGAAGATTFGAGPITLGSNGSSANASIITTSSQTYLNPIATGSSSGILTMGGNSGNPIWSGGVTLNGGSTLTLAYLGTAIATIGTANISGTGNIVISSGGGTSTVTISSPSINILGTITNSGSGTGTTTISGGLGANVTGITENSATSKLSLSGADGSFVGTLTAQSGTLGLATSTLSTNNLASIGSGATLDMAGFNLSITGLNNISGSGGTLLDSNTGGVLTLTGTGAYAFSGNVTSPANVVDLSIVKTGTGSQTLTGTNTFNGGVTVNSGSLTMSTFTHSAGQAANSIINGTNLGQDSTTIGAGIGRLFLTGTPTLVGTTAALSTGDNSAAKNTQIVPFLVGESGTAAGAKGTASGTANTFLTYNAGTGLRPLNPTDEFTNNSIVSGNNTRITTSTTNTATTAINSLVMSGTAASVALTINDGFTLTDTSGAILFVNSGTIKPSTSTGTLDFGSAEAFITVDSGITGGISAPVTTSGGQITASGVGILNISGTITTSGNNLTLTSVPGAGLFTASGGIASTGSANLVINANGAGGITLSTGTVNNQGTITNSGIGAGTATISSVIGANVTGINQSSTTSILNLSGVANTFTGPIIVGAGTTLQIGGDGSAGNAANVVTLNGGTLKTANDFILNHGITLNSSSTLTGGTIIAAGNITGPGALTVVGTVQLSGSNTYGGGTVQGGSLRISSDANIGGTSTALTLVNSSFTLSILGDGMTAFGSHSVTFTGGVSASQFVDIQSPTNVFSWDKNDTASVNSASTTAVLEKTGQGTLNVTVAQTYNQIQGIGGVNTRFDGGIFEINAPAGGSLATQSFEFSGGTLYLLGKSNASFTQSMLGMAGPSSGSGLIAGGGNIIVDNNNSTGATATTLNLGALDPHANNFTTAGASLNISTINLGSGSAVITTTTTNDATGILGAGRITYTASGSATGFASIVSGTTLGAYTGGTAFVTTGATPPPTTG